VVDVDAVGGPVIDEFGKVVGILGGSVTPGLRVGRRMVTANPGLGQLSVATTTATVMSAVPASLPLTTRSLADLRREGMLTTPLTPMPEFIYGGTTLQLPGRASETIRDTTEFSTRDDAAINIYTMWMKRSKLPAGEMSFTVFDADNHVRSSIPPRKVTLQDREQRFAVSWSPKGMPPGFYRIDVAWNGKPAWRVYVRVVE